MSSYVFVKADGKYQAFPEQRRIELDEVSISDMDFELVDRRTRGIAASQLGDSSHNGIATPTVGFGVNSSNGNFFYSQIDAAMPGKDINFTFIRYYNSQIGGGFSSEAAGQYLSERWRHSYEIQLVVNEASGEAKVIWGDGRIDRFFKLAGTWLGGSPGNFNELYQEGGNWVVETQSHLKYVFNIIGQLQKLSRDYENGNGSHELTLTYNASNQIASIIDTADREINFFYNEENRLVRMDLPGPISDDCHGTGKRSVTYGYTSEGALNQIGDLRCYTQRYIYSASTMSILWKNTPVGGATEDTPKLKVSFDDEGRVEKQETGLNLTSEGGVHLFTWGTDSLAYQSPTGADNAIFTRDDNYRAVEIDRSGKAQTISYNVTPGPDSILPNGLNDFENNAYALDFDDSDLKEVILPDGRKQTLSYVNHDLTGLTNESGLTLSINRNGAGYPQMLEVSGTNINSSHKPGYALSYATGDLLSMMQSDVANGLKTEITSHHSDGQPLEVRRYLDDTNYLATLYAYDSAGRRISMEDHRGTITCYYYDNADNVIDTVGGLTGSCPVLPPNASAEIRRTQYEYDAETRVTRIIQGFGSAGAFETSYEYGDTTGVLVRSCGPASSRCTDYRYDRDGKVEFVTRPDSRKDRFYALASGRIRITRENADLGFGTTDRIVRYQFDGNGRQISESSCISMEYPEDTISDCSEDPILRKRTHRDNLGRITQVELVTDTNNDIKRIYNYAYSADGLTTTVSVIGATQEEVYTRDALGNLIRVAQTDGGQTLTANYEYDGDSRLIKTTDPEGLITTFDYDGLGRLISRTDLSGTTTWAYNDLAGAVRISKSDGSFIEVMNNRLGEVSAVTTSDGMTFAYAYDSLGRVDTESWSGSGGNGARDYDYTAYNEVDKVTGPFGKEIDYSWDVMNRLTGKVFDGHQFNYIYNGLDQLKTLRLPTGESFSFGWDNYTNAQRRTTYPPSAGLETIFSRNDLGELIGLSTKKGSATIVDYQISLDDLGRRRSISAEQPLAPGFGNETLTISQQDDGLLDRINGETVGYNGRGDITSLPVPYAASFSYDALDRVSSVNATTHRYDAGRTRIETTRDDVTTKFLWDYIAALPDMTATMSNDNEIQRIYAHGPGGLLAEIDPEGKTRYVIQDFNSNVVALTDPDGSVTSQYAYTPFGRNAGIIGDTLFPFRFAGGVGVITDPEGVQYMRARYYHPGIQQFTSPDLIPGDLSRPQSLHRYAYIEGMGLGGVDPSGLLFESYDDCVKQRISDVHARFPTTHKKPNINQIQRLCRPSFFQKFSENFIDELADEVAEKVLTKFLPKVSPHIFITAEIGDIGLEATDIGASHIQKQSSQQGSKLALLGQDSTQLDEASEILAMFNAGPGRGFISAELQYIATGSKGFNIGPISNKARIARSLVVNQTLKINFTLSQIQFLGIPDCSRDCTIEVQKFR